VTCDELRERIVDPASAAHGGHAPLVAHLEECAGCRAAARDYGALERIVRPAAAPSPPPEFEQDLRARLLAGPRRPVLSVWLLAGSLAVLALGGLVVPRLLRARPGKTASPAAQASVPSSRAPDAEPPDILAVRSAPISLQAAPLTAEEKAEAASLHDFDFLYSFETLARLGPFFPEPAGPRAPVPAAAGGHPSDPPGSPDALTGRLLDWQRTAKAERARLAALDRAFRGRPDDERALLEDRWRIVSDLPGDQRAGLRRLASRIDELDPRARERLESAIRAVSRLPKEQRAARWRALPFARPLTGQELASAERLLLSR
jgi:hypothetical protein